MVLFSLDTYVQVYVQAQVQVYVHVSVSVRDGIFLSGQIRPDEFRQDEFNANQQK